MAESHCTTWEVTGFGRRECGGSIVQMGDESSSDGMEGWRSSGLGKSGVNSGLATSYCEKRKEQEISGLLLPLDGAIGLYGELRGR